MNVEIFDLTVVVYCIPLECRYQWRGSDLDLLFCYFITTEYELQIYTAPPPNNTPLAR